MTEAVLDVRALLVNKEEESSEDETLAPVLDIDLGNLLAFDYQDQPKDAKLIKDHAERVVQGLFDQVFNLPVTKSDVGPLAQLPYPKTGIPREKPIPKPKPPTKWEAFAKEKGIQKQKKRSRMAFDEVSGEYKPRFGAGRAADPVADSWVLEDKPGELKHYGAEDPFELARKKKKDQREQQAKREEANRRRRENAVSDPVTLSLNHVEKRPKEAIQKAISLTQKSTASMGKFDKAFKDEPKIKMAPKHMPTDFSKEQELTKKIADRILRDMPEIDANLAANQVIQKEQQQNRARNSRGERPNKRRKQ
eukprot:TRINITY_DN14216_c0_g1_i1.p1 TRINITY_DN14216_c0_g1~~TRINITY_DN14216_c0_g1_i1.p1  ORF type:complete len:307 (+),score=98.36 TRINITY_DN14216_c0_g1_i1:54-974(+)